MHGRKRAKVLASVISVEGLTYSSKTELVIHYHRSFNIMGVKEETISSTVLRFKYCVWGNKVKVRTRKLATISIAVVAAHSLD